MVKIWQILAAISVVIVAVVLFFKFAANHGKQEEIIDHQQEQIEIQHEVIEVKKQVQQRKAIARAVSTNNNLEWLRKARCKDCAV